MIYRTKRLLLFSCITLLASHQLFAQLKGQARIDSLTTVLSQLNLSDPSRETSINKVNTLDELAYMLYREKPDSTLKLAKSALFLAKSISYDKGITYSYYLVGLGNSYLNNNDSATFYFHEALAAAGKINDKNIIARTCNSLSHISRFNGNYHQADSLVKISLRLWEELKDEKGIGVAINTLANIYHQSGDYDNAIIYYNRSMAISEKLNDKASVARCLNGIGKIYSIQGNYPKALDFLFRSLKISEEISEKRNAAICYYNIGTVYQKTRAYADALIYGNKSLKMHTEMGNKVGMGEALIDIGHTYSLLMNDSLALKNYNEALTLYKSIDGKNGMADIYTRLGDIHYRKKQIPEAIAYYNDALQLRLITGDNLGLTESYDNLAGCYLDMHKPEEAKMFALKSVEIAKKTNTKPELKIAYMTLSVCDSILNDWKSAYNHLKLSFLYKDTIFNEESTRRLAQAQANYETEKKEKEIVVLQNEKVMQQKELSRQKAMFKYTLAGISAILLSLVLSFYFFKRKQDAEHRQKETDLNLQVSETEMKALRSQMNPHFIFNALQSIQAFLINHRSEEANIYLLKFSKLMRAVLENSQHHEISLKKDMQALELYMQLESIRLTHPFTYQFHVDESIDLEETTIPPLILQPFVENAIWHGLQYKPEPGHINIYISKKENNLYATVEDNGIGRDMSKQGQQPILFKKESLGMKLTEERLKILNELKKIKAQFRITDLFSSEQRPNGTRVELFLPLET